ncbi:MAG: isochorismatase family protein, partial [Snodgrassella alvi]|nr:isochorismatase family protein [Snodgrassella alvi]
IHLTGVCTDICVLHTAVDAYNLNYKIVIHQSAVASFDSIGHEWALNHFQNTLGAIII